MAASSKKSGAKAKPIEGEILSSEESASGSEKSDGVDTFRRFVWFVTGAAVVFIAGLVAAPAIQRSVDSFLGNDAPEPVAIETAQVAPPQVDTAEAEDVVAEVVPEEIREQVSQEATEEIAAEITEDITENFPVETDTPAQEPALASASEAAPEPEIASPIPDQRIRELTELVNVLEARLAILETRPVQEPRDSDDNAAAERIALLEARLAKIESSEPAVFSGLATSSGNDGLLLALARLSQRLESGQGFSGEMLEFKTRFDAQPASQRSGNEVSVEILAGYASGGVKTPAMLRRSFATALPTAIEAAALPEDAGWWDKVWAGLKSMVVVRRTGEVEGGSAEAVLARIEFYLGEGDVAAALGETEKLEPRVLAALESWQADADRRVAARQATATLIESFSAIQSDALTPSGPPTPSVKE